MSDRRSLGVACLSLMLFAASCADAPRQAGPVPAATDADYQVRPTAAQFALGKALFHDKILSGNLNMSCASCHHALADTGDGLSLPIGEGARGLGVTRDTGTGADAVHERVPRNSPHLFNLGALEFTRMFHDGRVEVDTGHPSGFRSPAGDDLPLGLTSALAVQAMFPVTSPTEMAGQDGENAIADAAVATELAGPDGVWEQLANRLQAVPGYVSMFKDAYPEIVSATDITYVHAANAIAAFEAFAFRADDSQFDRYLRGNAAALSSQARSGMKLFYGKAGCESCHTGTFQTDQSFHSICIPPIGPGKGDGFDGHDDFGRERVTGSSADRYQFRTPSLRNVALTGPWGHSGAYDSLEAVVRHHLDPLTALGQYDSSQAVLPSRPDLDALDRVVVNDPARMDQLVAANQIEPVDLTDREVGSLLAFLEALTDPSSIDLRNHVPQSVPSGLTLAE